MLYPGTHRFFPYDDGYRYCFQIPSLGGTLIINDPPSTVHEGNENVLVFNSAPKVVEDGVLDLRGM